MPAAKDLDKLQKYLHDLFADTKYIINVEAAVI